MTANTATASEMSAMAIARSSMIRRTLAVTWSPATRAAVRAEVLSSAFVRTRTNQSITPVPGCVLHPGRSAETSYDLTVATVMMYSDQCFVAAL
jgi:hypothetical protein